MNEQINACVNSPWNDLASFAFCTLRTIYLAAGLHMKLQYWDFCFASPTMVGLNKMLFRFQMLNWYSVKSLTASSCKKLKGLTLSPFGCYQGKPGCELPARRSPSTPYSCCLQTLQRWVPHVPTCPSPSLPLPLQVGLCTSPPPQHQKGPKSNWEAHLNML